MAEISRLKFLKLVNFNILLNGDFYAAEYAGSICKEFLFLLLNFSLIESILVETNTQLGVTDMPRVCSEVEKL